MPDIHPNDIGLATFNDVGDVTKLKTAAKNVVEALNEIFDGAGSGSGGLGKQLYVEGENNIIIGENNIVYGNNNLIIGSDNIIVGDNHTIVASETTKFKSEQEFYLDRYDTTDQCIRYVPTSSLPLSVGDKITIEVSIDWTDSSWTDIITVSSGLCIKEVLEIDASTYSIKIGDIGLPSGPPDDTHTDMIMCSLNKFTVLNDAYKSIAKPGSVSFGYSAASGNNSVSFGSAFAKGDIAFAANLGVAEGNKSTAQNFAHVYSTYGFGCNEGECIGESSAALNRSIVYSPYSLAWGLNTYTIGRAIKCTAINTSSSTLTVEPNQNISDLVGKEILIRGYNYNNSLLMTKATVSKISNNVLSLKDVYFGSGSYALTLFPDPYAFVIDKATSNSCGCFSGGKASIASCKYTFSHGEMVLAAANGAVIFGKYGNLNDEHSLALANGTSLNEPGIAFKVLSDGSVHADAEYSTPCADYAEFFEWEDGNPDAEDRVGYFVKLKGDKISFCEDFDIPIGIVSATPAIIGDSSELHWKNKFFTDEFGRIQYHDVIVPEMTDENGNVITEEHLENQPIINPDWNKDESYIPRSKRPEWAPVGVLGKLIVYDDGTLKPGDICRPGSGGIAVKSIENGYNVLKRISDDKVMIWFKG